MDKRITYKDYMDCETGEVIKVPQMFHRKPKNQDFDMIFYGHLLDILNDLGNKRIQVLKHIVKNRERANNTFIGTIRDIANDLNISPVTVNNTLVLLEDKEVIKRRTGVIYIDPDLVCDGRFKGHIMHVYSEIEDELTTEQKDAKFEREIKKAEEQIKKLQNLRIGLKGARKYEIRNYEPSI